MLCKKAEKSYTTGSDVSRAENANYVNSAAIRNDIPFETFRKLISSYYIKFISSLFALLFPNTVFICCGEKEMS